MSEKQFLNKSQGEEHKLPCIKCTGRTAHKVLLSVDRRGSDKINDFSWAVDYQIVQCLGCKTISFRKASSNSEDYCYDEDGNCISNLDEELYPSRLEGRKGIEEEIHYLPLNVRGIYQETFLALTNGAPILAGIGLRALLEAVCKEKEAAGASLFQKLDNLTAAGILTPTGAAILHKIRTLGNTAAHEIKPHNYRQLGLAMDIVEHLLKDVYILPKQVESEFED